MTHPPTNPPSDPGGGSTGPGRTSDPLPQTGATVEVSPVANGVGQPNLVAPAGDSERVEIVLGSPVPLVDVSRPFGVLSGRWGYDSRRVAS